MGRLLNCLKNNRRCVQAYLDEKQPGCTPKRAGRLQFLFSKMFGDDVIHLSQTDYR